MLRFLAEATKRLKASFNETSEMRMRRFSETKYAEELTWYLSNPLLQERFPIDAPTDPKSMSDMDISKLLERFAKAREFFNDRVVHEIYIRNLAETPNAIVRVELDAMRSVKMVVTRPLDTFTEEQKQLFILVYCMRAYYLFYNRYVGTSRLIDVMSFGNKCSVEYNWKDYPGPSRGYETAAEVMDRDSIRSTLDRLNERRPLLIDSMLAEEIKECRQKYPRLFSSLERHCPVARAIR